MRSDRVHNNKVSTFALVASESRLEDSPWFEPLQMISNGEQLNIVSQSRFIEERESVIGGRRNVTLIRPERNERTEVAVQWEEIMSLVSSRKYIDEITGETLFSKIVYGTIDTSRRLADINALNNSTQWPVKTRLDHLMGYTIDRNTYNLNLRPDLWYNNTDGIKFGVHADGNYMRFLHNFEADVWFNSRIGQSWFRDQLIGGDIYDPIAFRFSYSHPLDKWIKNSTIFFQTKWMDGIAAAKLTLNKVFSDKFQTYLSFKTFGMTNDYSLNYQYLPDLARSNGMNTSLSLGFNFNNVFSNIYQKSRLEIRTSLLNQNSYSFISSENTFKKWLGRTLESARFFGRIGVHASENGPAFNLLLNAGGANT
jgi:hypothetical protein